MMGPDNLSKSFGLTIAFLIPGAVGLYAASYFVPEIRDWFAVHDKTTVSVGGFLFVILGSIGMGVFVGAIRWAVLESSATRSTRRFYRRMSLNPRFRRASRRFYSPTWPTASAKHDADWPIASRPTMPAAR